MFGFGPGSWLMSAQPVDEQGKGITSGYDNTTYQDIPPPPPPPPQAGSADDWANPYTGRPALVGVPATSEPSMWDTWFKRGQQVTTGLVDIFGRAVTPAGQPVATQRPPSTGIPLLGWVAIGVGGVVVLGVAARALRPSRSYAGYKRRRHKR